MAHRKFLVSLVAVLVLAVLAANASALGSFTSIEVNGDDALATGANIATFAGQTIPVRVIFDSDDVTADDVRVKVWISGARDYSVSSERFDVLPNRTYSRLLSVQVPFDVDPEEDLMLNVAVESRNDGDVVEQMEIPLAAQRESYIVEILDVEMDNNIRAGSNLAVDIVLKNRGRQFAEDTFVRVRIPSLAIERKAYFGDLSPLDQSDPDKEDAAERRMFLSIPTNAAAGVYLVEVEAYNADSTTLVTKKLAIVGAGGDSRIVSSANSKTFAAGEEGIYSLTLVNTGNNVRVYELAVDAPAGLSVEADEPVVAVPAGASRTVRISAESEKAGKYTFDVDVQSDGQLVEKETYMANVEGSSGGVGTNATVLLTIVLAIIFVILLVVLIVLLTRRPARSEEFGESYY